MPTRWMTTLKVRRTDPNSKPQCFYIAEHLQFGCERCHVISAGFVQVNLVPNNPMGKEIAAANHPGISPLHLLFYIYSLS